MGKGGGGGGSIPGLGAMGDLARVQANIAKGIYGESTPLRQSLTASTMAALGIPITAPPAPATGKNGKPVKSEKGAIPPVDLTGATVIPGLYGATPAERAAIEAQFNVAKENTIGMAPSRGSALNRNLTDINIARATDVSGLVSQEKQRALSTALGVAYNTPSQAMNGLQGASNTMGQMAQIQMAGANQQSQQKGQMGSALGKMAVGGLGKLCWIAAEIYGAGSDEYYLARHFIFAVWDSPLAHIVQGFYLKYGKRIAAFLHRHPVFKPLVKPLFDLAVAKARGQLCQIVS